MDAIRRGDAPDLSMGGDPLQEELVAVLDADELTAFDEFRESRVDVGRANASLMVGPRCPIALSNG